MDDNNPNIYTPTWASNSTISTGDTLYYDGTIVKSYISSIIYHSGLHAPYSSEFFIEHSDVVIESILKAIEDSPEFRQKLMSAINLNKAKNDLNEVLNGDE